MSTTPPPKPFAGVNTRADVARLLNTSVKQLNLLLQARPEHLRYSGFTVPKRRGGSRTIFAPRDDLKVLQLKLAAKLHLAYRPRKVVYGFVKERSIVGNADQHVACRHVLNVDLKDFFPTINFGRVRGLFMSLNASRQAATVLAQICCHQGALPQGAPTSPVVSNMICVKMDRQLLDLAMKHNCKYTRYADDLTFSRKRGAFPSEMARIDEEDGRAILGKELREIIERSGFIPHPEKVWLFSRLHRQMVTGLVVNAKRNVPRKFVRQLRAMIHAWEAHGLQKAEAEYHSKYRSRPGEPPFPLVVRGRMEFLKMVKGMRDPVYRRLQQRLVQVDESYYAVMEKESNLMDTRDVFISHASEDKDDVARPLTEMLVKEGLTVWYDEYDIGLGDSILEQIDRGLRVSRFGVVIMSPSYFAARKTWTKRELDGLVAAEDVNKSKRILPIWHNLTHKQVFARSATLAGRHAALTADKSLEAIADMIVKKVKSGEVEESLPH